MDLNYALQRKTKHPFSFRIRRDIDHTICTPDRDAIHVYPVRVYTPRGKLKKTISVKKLKARPMEKGLFHYET